ncbi:hypothetical protein HDU97_002860 [Phlyctochytrium planicorne]|nr:hypothetical protein HDU97_002860 [Phlyctochytrium planicorne]
MHTTIKTLLATFTVAHLASAQIVKLDYITVNGTTSSSVVSWKGIPFAAPPVGALRWMPPQPPIANSTVFNASSFGPSCLSSSGGMGGGGGAPPISFPSTENGTSSSVAFGPPAGTPSGAPLPAGAGGSEDCLTINIIAPSNATPDSKLPIIMWTYGGGFEGGSSNADDGSTIVASSNGSVIYVSFNYRIGLFGFFSNAKLLAEGHGANFGLLDQLAAYKWVQKYISLFGGDPNRITAFGQSAGSQSIAMQMIAYDGESVPFQAAMMESGTYTSFHDTTSIEDQANYTATIAKTVGCASASDLMACLRAVNTSTIAAANTNDWKPVVDGIVLKDMPINRVLQGKIAKIPVILGTNTNEGAGFASSVTSQDQFTTYLQSNFKWLTSANMTTVASLYAESDFTTASARAAEVFGDVVFVCPSERFAAEHSKLTGGMTYRYRWNYSAATHGGEIKFVYNTTGLNSTEQPLANLMTSLWISFTKTQSVSSILSAASLPSWPSYTSDTKQQLLIDSPISSIKVEVDGAYMPKHDQRCAFWEAVDVERAGLWGGSGFGAVSTATVSATAKATATGAGVTSRGLRSWVLDVSVFAGAILVLLLA